MNIPYNYIIQLKYLPKQGQTEKPLDPNEKLIDELTNRYGIFM